MQRSHQGLDHMVRTLDDLLSDWGSHGSLRTGGWRGLTSVLKGELDPERSDLGCSQSQAKEIRLGMGGGRVDPKRGPAQEADFVSCARTDRGNLPAHASSCSCSRAATQTLVSSNTELTEDEPTPPNHRLWWPWGWGMGY